MNIEQICYDFNVSQWLIGLKAYTEVGLIKVNRKWVSKTHALESTLMIWTREKALYFPFSPLPKTCGDRTMCHAWFCSCISSTETSHFLYFVYNVVMLWYMMSAFVYVMFSCCDSLLLSHSVHFCTLFMLVTVSVRYTLLIILRCNKLWALRQHRTQSPKESTLCVTWQFYFVPVILLNKCLVWFVYFFTTIRCGWWVIFHFRASS